MLPFLEERFSTVLEQTFGDWEMFVFDGFSDDGAWEYIKKMASGHPKIKIAQGPRQGPYPAWNECIRRTCGEYVYIATSDDTMAPNFLEKMVSALDRHPECEIAHSPLRMIDAVGSPNVANSWPECTIFADPNSEFDMVNRPHIRFAPYDGLLHLSGRQVYLSITQLLIRRSLFDRIGVFPSKWGALGDVEWEMRAGLIANTVHVPDTWATWRTHPQQLTRSVRSLEVEKKRDEIILETFNSCSAQLKDVISKSHWPESTRRMRSYYRDLEHHRRVLSRRLYQVQCVLRGPVEVRSEILRQFARSPKWPDRFPSEIRSWLGKNGLTPPTVMASP